MRSSCQAEGIEIVLTDILSWTRNFEDNLHRAEVSILPGLAVFLHLRVLFCKEIIIGRILALGQ